MARTRCYQDGKLISEDFPLGPGRAYGPSGDNYVRVSFAAEEGRLREGLNRLARFVAESKGAETTVATAEAYASGSWKRVSSRRVALA